MNIQQANAIPLTLILEKMGAKPAAQKGANIFYHAPYRDDKTASLHVTMNINKWYDFGITEGGNVVDLVCKYLQSQNHDYTPVDALRWIRNMTGNVQPVQSAADKSCDGPTLQVVTVGSIKNNVLKDYLESRGITLEVAKNYLHQVLVSNAKTGKKFYALGLRTEGDGYELRNSYFKGCTGSKHISFIRGSSTPATEIHVFEGIMDFLAALENQENNVFAGDAIVLNSVSNVDKAKAYIKDYHYTTIYTWLDNDAAGEKATCDLKAFAEEEKIPAFQTMNKTYSGHADLNEWYRKTLTF